MKVDTQPFPNINMMEGYDRSTRRQLDFMLGINMAGHASRQHTRKQEADSRDRPQKEERDYITEEQVRHVRNQRPVSLIFWESTSISINSISNVRLKKKSTSGELGNA
jgi:hypothetical protein